MRQNSSYWHNKILFPTVLNNCFGQTSWKGDSAYYSLFLLIKPEETEISRSFQWLESIVFLPINTILGDMRWHGIEVKKQFFLASALTDGPHFGSVSSAHSKEATWFLLRRWSNFSKRKSWVRVTVRALLPSQRVLFVFPMWIYVMLEGERAFECKISGSLSSSACRDELEQRVQA